MKKATRNDARDTRKLYFILIAVAVMATIGTLFLCTTLLQYWAIRDNFQFALENAGKLGWSSTLVNDANSAQTALQAYAQSNLFAGILYALNGSFIKKLLQFIIILATIAFGFATFAYDACIIYCIVSNIREHLEHRNRRRRTIHRKSNVYPISAGKSRAKRNTYTA